MNSLEDFRLSRLFHFTRLVRIAETYTIDTKEDFKNKLKTVKKLKDSLIVREDQM